MTTIPNQTSLPDYIYQALAGKKASGRLLKKLFPKDHLTGVSADEKEREICNKIITVITSYFNLTEGQLRSRRRFKEIVFPRQLAHYFIRRYTSLTVFKIGVMTMHDHSTITNNLRKVQDDMETNHERRRIITYLESRILESLGKDHDNIPEPVIRKERRPIKRTALKERRPERTPDINYSMQINPCLFGQSKYRKYATI